MTKPQELPRDGYASTALTNWQTRAQQRREAREARSGDQVEEGHQPMTKTLVCPCDLEVRPETKRLHGARCPLDTRSREDRIAQAIGDPGSVVGRRRGPTWGEGNDGYAELFESSTRWSTRAVVAVLDAESSLAQGLMFLADAPGIGDHVPGTDRLRCQIRVANADGVTFRCGERASHGTSGRRCNFVAESGQAKRHQKEPNSNG